jgi:HD-GYP domain-containing protein (c-di-GMP phosphodiesterase class II)
VRLLEVLAALSLATDLGSGFAPEKGLRTCVAAVAIARQAGLDDDDTRVVLQTSLLRALGCTAFASENAWHFGDDLAFQRDLHTLDPSDPASFDQFGSWAGEVRGAELRAHFLAIAATVGPQAGQASCEASRDLGTRLGLRSEAIAALDQVAERWDGRGFPGVAQGEALTLAARILHVAEQAVLAHHAGGPAATVGLLERRGGGQLDPALVAMVLASPEELLAALAVGDPLAAALEAEPAPRAMLPIDALDRMSEAFADLADLKSRFTLGHSRGVARLADRAAVLSGLDDEARARLRRAALLHDVGRTSVSTAVWERPGPLSPGETDQVRLHPFWSERVLARAPALAPLAPLAGIHHERLDGSGYHRGAAGPALSREARLLAAADVMHALREPRPHRAGCDLAHASVTLEQEARTGRLDPGAVGAVIEAAGARASRRAWPVDLTDREVEVLRLTARGLSNKEIADRLVVSARTVQHHLAHVYDKTGRRTRAGAALFAMEHGLVEPDA